MADITVVLYRSEEGGFSAIAHGEHCAATGVSQDDCMANIRKQIIRKLLDDTTLLVVTEPSFEAVRVPLQSQGLPRAKHALIAILGYAAANLADINCAYCEDAHGTITVTDPVSGNELMIPELDEDAIELVRRMFLS